MWFQDTIDVFFSLVLFVNAALLIPQAIKLFESKGSRELSLTTFVGFNAIQFFTVLYGVIHKSYLLIIGWTLCLITDRAVTMLVLIEKVKINQITLTPKNYE